MSDEQGVNPGLRELISQLAINVAVLTSTVDDLKGLIGSLQSSTASKESVERMSRDLSAMQVDLKAVDEKHDKKWDRLLWAVFSFVLLAGLTALYTQGGLGK